MVRNRTRLAGLIALVAVLAVAALLTRFDLRLANSQALVLPVAEVKAKVPLDDPLASIWDGAQPLEIPMTAQNIAVPQGGGSIPAVVVRALHDRDNVYFRMEWQDATQNGMTIASQDFRDGAAIEFPAKGVSTVPSFCMGQPNGNVNIWHWKADWQADIDNGYVSVQQQYPDMAVDYYDFEKEDTFLSGRAAGNLMSAAKRTSPVEDLVAKGFGTLTTAVDQDVKGKGVWQDGKWYVIFSRSMETKGDVYTPFNPGQITNVAFAVWDGAKQERNGLKSVSQFADLSIEGTPGGGGGGDATRWVFLGVVLAVAALTPAFIIATRKMRRRA